MLMETLQLTGVVAYESYMVMHTSNVNIYISLARDFHKDLSDPTRKHGLMDQVNGRKRDSKGKCTECGYHVQYRKYVLQKSIRCNVLQTSSPIYHLVGCVRNPMGLEV